MVGKISFDITKWSNFDAEPPIRNIKKVTHTQMCRHQRKFLATPLVTCISCYDVVLCICRHNTYYRKPIAVRRWRHEQSVLNLQYSTTVLLCTLLYCTVLSTVTVLYCWNNTETRQVALCLLTYTQLLKHSDKQISSYIMLLFHNCSVTNISIFHWWNKLHI